MRASWLARLAFLGALVAGGAQAQDLCAFSINGTWEAQASRGNTDPPPPTRYTFGADGMVVTLSPVRGGNPPEWQEGRQATRFFYKLDNPRAPKSIEMRGPDGSTLRGAMKISQFDEGSFTTVDGNGVPMRWTRVDPEHHFAAFVATRGDAAHGGTSFVALISTDAAGRPRWESFGLYLAEDTPIVGPIPAELTRRLMTESRLDTQTMLRVELTASEYQRALAVMQTWQRRARERTLLYEVPYLNNIVFLDQVSGSLNVCSSRIKVQKLGWKVGDPITAAHNLPQVPFFYIHELRQQNDAIHLANDQFRRRMGSACGGDCTMPPAASVDAPPLRR